MYRLKNFFCILFLITPFTFTGNVYGQSKQDPFKKINPLQEKLQPLPFSEIKPTGWLKDEIEKNLAGFTGHLDSLVPSLMIDDDIYGRNRLTKKVKNKDVGALSDGGNWQVQFLWWNSESQSNWCDGYIRSAVLVNDQQYLARIRKYVAGILSTQDSDGYLGIYDKDLRYKFNNENGELWAKTTLLRGLLAWYEYTKDKKVLTAIERAVKNVMVNYPVNASHPFYSVTPYVGGLTHGLMFVDILENLYRITKNEAYRDYCLFLYKDFSTQVLNEDAQYKKLMDSSYKLKDHGVHTYEHLRAVAAAYYASGNNLLGDALKDFLEKISRTTTVTGAPIGDEWIGGRNADETSTGYEYCSMQELMNSYEDLFIKTGDATFGDKIEKLFFNAAQGSRDPGESCIAYLKTDNSYYMTGGLNGGSTDKKQTRYSYSPVHQAAAVCCVPNAGRIFPYYVQDMWMKDKDDLVASLLGPCELTATIKRRRVTVEENTSYPFGNTIEFKIHADQPVPFNLKIRKPAWADTFSVSESYKEENGFIVINKIWKGNEKIVINFYPQPEVKKDLNNEYYFTYGALVLAHPVEATAAITRNYPLAGFHDFSYTPVSLVIYHSDGVPAIETEDIPGLRFSAMMYNPVSHKDENIQMVPVGKTILRQVSFKNKTDADK
ncbi:MAG TPA: beta-L-arabinofuranosidase domain-containing protein [Chitinophagaceae bacterium]|nr:beta-L-arabinofuranosidase domain-containing protein [Chitinophagaceae bacterium]